MKRWVSAGQKQVVLTKPFMPPQRSVTHRSYIVLIARKQKKSQRVDGLRVIRSQRHCSDSAELKGRHEEEQLSFSAYLCGHDLPPVKTQKYSSDFVAHGHSI